MRDHNTLPSAPDLLIEAADTIAARATERGTQRERSMLRAVDLFNAWKGQPGAMTEHDGWMFMAFLKMARAANSTHRRDDYIDGAAYLALACEHVERSLDLDF